MGHTLPKLRADLTIRPQETKSGKVFIVKDAVSGRFFRFGEAEGFILRQLDGETSLDVIRRRAREELGGEVEPEVLIAFIKELRSGGILVDENGSSQDNRSRNRRIRGNILFLRFKIFDPTWAFDHLSNFVRFCFTPYFIIFSAILILLAMGEVLIYSADLSAELRALMQASSIPLYVFFALFTVALHEFAHGLTCRYFGGDVHEIGFLLIYFQPALYCNVSDAWLFPEKSKRLWVSFAGPYFELFVWAVAVFTWRATEPDTFINQCALIVTAVSGVKTLFNFNPLIKLDGYYLLSDFLEIPNLRMKSFRMVGDLLRKVTGRLQPGAVEESRRDRIVCLAYGLVASAGSIAVIGSLALTAFKYLGAEGGSILLAVPVVFGLCMRIRLTMSRMFHRTRTSSSEDEDDEDLQTNSSSRPSDASSSPGKASAQPGHGYLGWAALAACAMLVLCALAGWPKQVFALNRAKNVSPAALTTKKDGAVKAHLKHPDRMSARRRPSFGAESVAAEARARNRAEYAQRKLDRARLLFTEGLITSEMLASMEAETAGAVDASKVLR